MNRDRILPDSDLSDELASFAQGIRDFAGEKLLPHARSIDEAGSFRQESVAELAEAGLLAGPIAKEHGGAGWSSLQLAIVHEEIGAVCGSSRGFLAVHCGLVAKTVETFANAAQISRVMPGLLNGESIGCFALTEEEAGSDVASLRCRAEADGEGYRISGKKIWITNGGVADLAIVFATVDPKAGREGITAFLIPTDRAGLQREAMPGKELGHRGSDHAYLVFNEMRAEPEEVIGAPGEGFRIAMGGLQAGRITVAAGAVGIHRAALQSSADFLENREQFGKPLSKFQMVQERLADMYVELLAARQLVQRCARRRDEGIETQSDVAAAKLYATEAAARAAEQAVMLHGSRGYSTEHLPERLLRDIFGLRIYEGTSMIQKLILARDLLG
ncbi:MAG: acyl-CoA dehydrogenase family protein [Planctomycetota bacterium]|jgi:alkylation response protein AidB-like acyl-CoA dehydrogenase